MKSSFGLRAALSLLVLIAIAPVVAVVVNASLSEQRTQLERAQTDLRAVVALGAANQERVIDGARQVLAAIAYSPAVYGDDLDACIAYMGRLQTQYPLAYGTFGVLDPQGDLTCRSSRPANGVNSSDRLFFRTAIGTLQFSVGEYTVSRASGRAVLTFGLPVLREEEPRLRGVAYLALDLAQAAEVMGRVALSPDTTLFVADRNGNVLAASGGRAVPTGGKLPEPFLLEAVQRGAEVAARATGADGDEWFHAVKPVGRAAGGQLFVLGLVSSQAVIGPTTQRLYHQLAALALIALLAAAIAWAFGDRIVARPMARLLGRVDALGREALPLDVAPATTGLRELAQLDARFHAMARSLADRSAQRDRASRSLKDSERRYRELFESNPHPMWVFDLQTQCFLEVNDAAVMHYGYSREEFLAMRIGDIRPPDDVPQLEAALADERHMHEPARWRHRRKDGSIIYVDISSHTLDHAGRPARMVLAHDVTQRVLAQEALEQLNETLERRVHERTRELNVSNRELESFAYSVSHDLRAPLQVIDGFGKALIARHAAQLDERAHHYLDRIRDNTRQMGSLIDDLLSLARVTRTELRQERTDLALRCRQVVERLRQRDPGRVVEVRIDDRILCNGDPGLLGVVMENLLENAWKFTARTPDARITVGSRREPNGQEVIFVADNGAGFEMTYADKLFKAFQRLHAASEFPGTGIGLATVQRIVSRHGGRVWAEGAPGQGALFQFTLKGRKDDEEQPHPAGGGQPRPPGAHADDAGGEQRPQ